MEFFGARMRLIISVIALLGAAGYPAEGDTARINETTPVPPASNSSLSSVQISRQLIQPAILASYYEHMREHAPPRRPGGAMQRRENFYRAPAEPFDLLNSRLGRSLADQFLRADLAKLHDDWEQGVHWGLPAIESMRQHASDSSLSAETLLEAGRGIQWLINEDVAVAFFAAGLAKARNENEGNRLSATQAEHLLHALDQTACLWRCNQPDALVDRFTIARRLTPPLSIQSRRAGYLLAESLLADERRDEAANLILRVDNENAQAGDLGRYEQSDISEMHFVAGFILFSAGRASEAIPYLLAVDGEHQENANHILFEAYLQTSDFARAQMMLRSTAIPMRRPSQPMPVSAELKDAMDRARWRAEIGPISDPPH